MVEAEERKIEARKKAVKEQEEKDDKQGSTQIQGAGKAAFDAAKEKERKNLASQSEKEQNAHANATSGSDDTKVSE